MEPCLSGIDSEHYLMLEFLKEIRKVVSDSDKKQIRSVLLSTVVVCKNWKVSETSFT